MFGLAPCYDRGGSIIAYLIAAVDCCEIMVRSPLKVYPTLGAL